MECLERVRAAEAIEIPCDIKFKRDPRGKPNNIYDLENRKARDFTLLLF